MEMGSSVSERERQFANSSDAPIREEDASAGSNAGKILSSTLWNQNGTIYVPINGEQTALSGHIYNEYCPFLSSSSSVRSVTGCSNTADSQILYYWVSKGAKLTLTVSSADYFILKSDGETYHLANVSLAGEGTIGQLNSALSVSNPVGDGGFIAALNFYCGVKNHSSYGSSTSTTWYYGAYTRGTNTAAFRSAGFDSHYFVNRKGSDYECSVFFDMDKGLTDVGFSILRENLDYGELIRVGIPGHAIYMDGYRFNSGTNEYEYHLNFGWGTTASATRWYTVAELNDYSEAYVTYVTVDLSPDISVNVTNNRGGYYGGSFLRGVERVNHIVSGRTRPVTFNFDSSVAGKSIALSTSVALTSGVGVNFTNLSAALSTTAGALLSSGKMMSFSVKNGSMAVNSAGAQYVVFETGGSQVTISLNSSYIYSGYYKAGVKKLDALLKNDGIYSYSGYSDSFYRTVQGSAVVGGSAADKVTLKNGSAIFGDMDLGAGKNTLNIENGSLYYGSFSGASGTLNANLSIRSASGDGPMIVLRDAASDAAFFKATGGRLKLSISGMSPGKHTYSLYRGADKNRIRNFTVSFKFDGKNYLLSSAKKTDGIFSVSYSDSQLRFSYKLTRPSVDRVTASTGKTTNQNVTVKASFSSGATKKYYSRDGGKEWLVYEDSGVVMKKNGTLSFKAMVGDLVSAVRSFTVRNIDKTAPDKPRVSVSTTAPTNQNVTVMASFSKDSQKKQYRIGGGNWQSYSGMAVMRANGNVSFRGIDAAGNISKVVSFTVKNIDRTAPARPKVTCSTAEKVLGSVRLTVSSDRDAKKLQYSADGRIWKNISGKSLDVTSNGRYFFRAADAAGNLSAATTCTVSNVVPKVDKSNNTWKAVRKDSPLNLTTAKKIIGWVGLGDAADFIKLEVQKKGRVSLDMNGVTAAARDAGQLDLKLLSRSGKAVSLTSLDGDTLASAGKLSAGVYYLGVSCADVKKFNTSYKITAGMLAG